MPEKRAYLIKEENRLMTEIDQQSDVLEQKAEKIIKTSLIVGASILAGYTIYSLLSGDSRKKGETKKPKQVQSRTMNNPLFKNIFQSAVKKGIEILLSEKQKKSK
jgi:hypothetical protein